MIEIDRSRLVGATGVGSRRRDARGRPAHAAGAAAVPAAHAPDPAAAPRAAGAPAPPAPADDADTFSAYRNICAVVNNMESALNLYFSRQQTLPPVSLVVMIGDGIGRAAPGGPSDGKIYGLFVKPFTVAKPQSPRHLIAWLMSLGSDSAPALAEVFAQSHLPELVRDLQTTRYGRPGVLTSIILMFTGDFPACCAMVVMPPQNRQWPSTPGRVPAWTTACCWLCGAAPHEIYDVGRGARWRTMLAAQLARVRALRCTAGLPPRAVFVEIVHSVSWTGQALLADLCIYYQKLHTNYYHPVAAFLTTLFPKSTWDVFLLDKHSGRTSNKPFFQNDPDVVWSFLLDVEPVSLLFALVQAHNVDWDMSPLPGGVAGSSLRRGSPMALITAYWMWFDAFVRGDSAMCRVAGATCEDLWRLMNSFTQPPAPDRPCACDPPSFVHSIVAFGPASHAAFCSAWRYIEFVDDAVPQWRDSKKTFAKVAAGICVEHGMKSLRAVFADYGIATRARRYRARELLERCTERSRLRMVLPDFEPVDERRGDGENRAYQDVPLSRVLDLEEIIPGMYRDMINVAGNA